MNSPGLPSRDNHSALSQAELCDIQTIASIIFIGQFHNNVVAEIANANRGPIVRGVLLNQSSF